MRARGRRREGGREGKTEARERERGREGEIDVGLVRHMCVNKCARAHTHTHIHTHRRGSRASTNESKRCACKGTVTMNLPRLSCGTFAKRSRPLAFAPHSSEVPINNSVLSLSGSDLDVNLMGGRLKERAGERERERERERDLKEKQMNVPSGCWCCK